MSNLRLKKRSLSQEDLFNFSELFKLMKPRVMSLVIFTCAVGLLSAPNLVSTKDAIIGILLVSLGAGAAGALNMWYESDLDALMTRTCLRPIPTGKVNRNQALIFGVTLSIISVIALDYFTNRISAGILLLTIFIETDDTKFNTTCLNYKFSEYLKELKRYSYWLQNDLAKRKIYLPYCWEINMELFDITNDWITGKPFHELNFPTFELKKLILVLVTRSQPSSLSSPDNFVPASGSNSCVLTNI